MNQKVKTKDMNSKKEKKEEEFNVKGEMTTLTF